jgi:hypothetical protein
MCFGNAETALKSSQRTGRMIETNVSGRGSFYLSLFACRPGQAPLNRGTLAAGFILNLHNLLPVRCRETGKLL